MTTQISLKNNKQRKENFSYAYLATLKVIDNIKSLSSVKDDQFSDNDCSNGVLEKTTQEFKELRVYDTPPYYTEPKDWPFKRFMYFIHRYTQQIIGDTCWAFEIILHIRNLPRQHDLYR